MDGRNALPDPKAERGECGDELECARLQLETGDENHRYRRLVEGDDGVKALAFAAPRGAKALHKRSGALLVLIMEICLGNCLAQKHWAEAYEMRKCFYTLWAGSGPLKWAIGSLVMDTPMSITPSHEAWGLLPT